MTFPAPVNVVAPDETTRLAAQFSVPVTVNVLLLATVKLLFNASVLPLATVKLILVGVNVPAVWSKEADAAPPVKLKEWMLLVPVDVNVPPL